MKKKLRKNLLRILAVILILIVVAGGTIAFLFWRAVYKENVNLNGSETAYVYISTGSEYGDLLQSVKEAGVLKNANTFRWLAGRKNLPHHVYPGRYEFTAGMNNDEIVDMLRSGAQKPLNVIFNNIRTSEQLAGVISRQIEADSAEIMRLLNDENILDELGLKPETVKTIFIPNTYEFFWNTSAEGFIERMYKEYRLFWNENRLRQAEQQKLSPLQVSILASIIDKETNRNDEKARIAGVYLNRLRNGWRLQADPTVVYAFYLENDSLLNRVYRRHTNMPSPYNTYLNIGLPPGPICIPSISGLEAALRPEDHDYWFFVAKADGSGYHHFSKTYNQHLRYAREHYDALNRK
ncbi:MAG: endolytic transglycosylase MltG [Bacteroidales bacterium]